MADSNKAKRKVTPRDVLRIAFRRRVLFALGTSVFAIVALAAMPHLSVFEKKYTGTAKFQRYELPSPTQKSGSFESYKAVLMHDLAGRNAVRQAIEDLYLTQGLPRGADGELTPTGEKQLQDLIHSVGERVSVAYEVRTEKIDLVSVSFTSPEPRLAQEVPNRLVRNYIADVSSQIIQDLNQRREFLQERVDEKDARLAQASRKRIEFERKHAGALPEGAGSLEERRSRASAEIDALRLQQKIAKQKLERLRAMAEQTDGDSETPIRVVKGPNPELERLRENLRSLREDLQDAKTMRHMTDKHPAVITLKEKIAQIERQIEQTPEEVVTEKVFGEMQREGLSVALAAAESEVEMLGNELARLERRLEAYDANLDNYGPVKFEWKELVDRETELEHEKRAWQKELRDIEASLAAEVAKRRNRLAQVQLAERQHTPSSPKLHYLLAFALVGGVAFGGSLVFLANTVDRSIWTPREAEQLFDLPVCGVTGKIVPPRTRVWQWLRKCFVEPGTIVLLLAAIGLGCLNVVLWLKYPAEYADWAAAPLAYLEGLAADAWASVQWRLNSL